MARRRHLSRIAVMQVLFERDRRPDIDCSVVLERDASELGEMDGEFAKTLLEGILAHEKDIQDAVQAHAPDWTFERMDPIARCVLMVGGFELLFTKDVPAAVVINEGIEMAKEFGTDESGRFVNGVLNAMAQGRAE